MYQKTHPQKLLMLVQIWLCFLCFEDSIGFESLKFSITDAIITSLIPQGHQPTRSRD